MATEEIILKIKTQVEGAQSIKDFRQAIKDINAELSSGKVAKGSAEYRELKAALASAMDGAGDLKEELRALDPSELGSTFARFGGTVAQGFAGAQAAAALFGAENENVQKAILKVQAAAQLAQTVQAAADFQKQAAIIRNIALTRLEEAEKKRGIIVTNGLTIAQRAWNLAMAANPILLIVAAIALLAAGVYALVKAYDTEISEVEKLQEEYDLLKEANDRRAASLKNEIELMKLKGATIDEIAVKERELLELEAERAAKNVELQKAKVKEAEAETSAMEYLYEISFNTAAAEKERYDRVSEQSKEYVKAKEEEAAALHAIEKQIVELQNAEKQRAIDNEKNRIAARQDGTAKELASLELDRKQAIEQATIKGLDLSAVEATFTKKRNDILSAAAKQARDAEIADIDLRQKLFGRSQADELRSLELKRINAVSEASKSGKDVELVEEDYRRRRAALIEMWTVEAAKLEENFRAKISEPIALPPIAPPDYEAMAAAADFGRTLIQSEYSKQQDDLKKHIDELSKTNADFRDKDLISQEQYEKNKTAIAQAETQARVDLAVNTIGNALKIAQGAFEENTAAYKAIAVAQATIDTFKSAQAAYGAMVGVPVIGPALGIAAAAAAVVAGIKNVQKILAVDPKGTTSSPSGGNPFVGTSSVTAVPSQGTPGFQTSTNLNPNGTVQQQNTGQQQLNVTVQASVSAVEMTDVQQNIFNIQQTSKL